MAQDLTRYGQDIPGWNLARLLTELCKIEGLDWLRLHYLYPHELTDELIDVIADEPKIVKYLDIPLQHINANILKKMNRRDTPDDIRALLKKLRARIPGLVLRTSLITGLPGEGEAEFEELCEFLREYRIERAGVFPFSPRRALRRPVCRTWTTKQPANVPSVFRNSRPRSWTSGRPRSPGASSMPSATATTPKPVFLWAARTSTLLVLTA